MISILVLALAATGAQSESTTVASFSFPEAEPPGYDCIYRHLTPEDRAWSEQQEIRKLEAEARDDKSPLPKDPTTKDRRKRSVAIGFQCEDEFHIPDGQMSGWVAHYTNAINTAVVARRSLDNADAARIEGAVKSLSPSDLAVLRKKESADADQISVQLIQVIFKTDKPMDMRSVRYSIAYMTSLISIRDIRLQWADWQKDEDQKAKAKAETRAR